MQPNERSYHQFSIPIVEIEKKLIHSQSLEDLPEFGDTVMGPPDAETGIILIHGFTGTNIELMYIGNQLAMLGLRVYLPLLPGHGTSSEHLRQITMEDWIQKIEDVVGHMREENEERDLILAGHSMGGTLSLLFSQLPSVIGVVVIAAPIKYPWHIRMIVKLLSFTRRKLTNGKMKFMDKRMSHNPLVKFIETNYHEIYFQSYHQVFRLLQLTRTILSDIQVPVLALQSIHDQTVPQGNMDKLAAEIQDLQQVWLDHSYHVSIADFDKEFVASSIMEFVQELLVV